jgi:hypothetical protein
LWPRVSNDCPSGFHPEILCHIGHHLYYSEHGKFHRNRFDLGFRCRDRSEQQIKTGNFLVIGYIQYTDQFGLLHHTRLAFNPDGDSVRPWVARRSQSITIIKKPIDPTVTGRDSFNNPVRLAARRRRQIWLAGAQGSHHPKSAQASSTRRTSRPPSREQA